MPVHPAFESAALPLPRRSKGLANFCTHVSTVQRLGNALLLLEAALMNQQRALTEECCYSMWTTFSLRLWRDWICIRSH